MSELSGETPQEKATREFNDEKGKVLSAVNDAKKYLDQLSEAHYERLNISKISDSKLTSIISNYDKIKQNLDSLVKNIEEAKDKDFVKQKQVLDSAKIECMRILNYPLDKPEPITQATNFIGRSVLSSKEKSDFLVNFNYTEYFTPRMPIVEPVITESKIVEGPKIEEKINKISKKEKSQQEKQTKIQEEAAFKQNREQTFENNLADFDVEIKQALAHLDQIQRAERTSSFNTSVKKSDKINEKYADIKNDLNKLRENFVKNKEKYLKGDNTFSDRVKIELARIKKVDPNKGGKVKIERRKGLWGRLKERFPKITKALRYTATMITAFVALSAYIAAAVVTFGGSAVATLPLVGPTLAAGAGVIATAGVGASAVAATVGVPIAASTAAVALVGTAAGLSTLGVGYSVSNNIYRASENKKRLEEYNSGTVKFAEASTPDKPVAGTRNQPNHVTPIVPSPSIPTLAAAATATASASSTAVEPKPDRKSAHFETVSTVGANISLKTCQAVLSSNSNVSEVTASEGKVGFKLKGEGEDGKSVKCSVVSEPEKTSFNFHSRSSDAQVESMFKVIFEGCKKDNANGVVINLDRVPAEKQDKFQEIFEKVKSSFDFGGLQPPRIATTKMDQEIGIDVSRTRKVSM